MSQCYLCKKEDESTLVSLSSDRPIHKVKCVNCGEYQITDLLSQTITDEGREAATWYINNGEKELLTTDNIDYIIQEYKISRQI